MTKHSAGLLLYRFRDGMLEVFLVHPGGPFWEKKDLGVWSIPKGELDAGEEAFEAARREFEEETGFRPEGIFRELRLRAAEKRKDRPRLGCRRGLRSRAIRSNTFAMEWPPRSGRQQEFPEVDRGGWFAVDLAKEKILDGQRGSSTS